MRTILWDADAIDDARRSLAAAESRMNSALDTARRMRSRLAASGQGSADMNRLLSRLAVEIGRMERYLDEVEGLRRRLARVSALFEETEAAHVRRFQAELDEAARFDGAPRFRGERAPRPEMLTLMRRAARGEFDGARSSGLGEGGGFSAGAGLGGGFGGGGGRSWGDAPEAIAGICALSGIERVGQVHLLPAAGGLFLPPWLAEP